MLFNSFKFIVLFPLIFALYYCIPARFNKLRNHFLLIVSYLLYVSWKPAYALILLCVTALTYSFALLIPKSRHPKRVLSLGVIMSLLPLVFFKYFNFINDTLRNVLSSIGLDFYLPGLNWVIPIGISFFTFQALGYLWDVYYGRQDAERDFLSYALFVSFFPCIVSGPINKASLIIPQLKRIRPYFDYGKVVGGGKLLLWGMFMKVVVADRVALYVDTVLPSYDNYSGATCLVASFLYYIQLYSDFAGYSLMSIGVGKILGFEVAENFRRPFFAFSVTDYWRRWHISLSTWLKDYVYIPMGGSRCSKIRNYWNIFVTFLVSGIWHGANWTFVVWGCIHGVCQIVEKMLGQQKCEYGRVGKSVKILVTFLIVNLALIFFRMPTLADAISVFRRIFDPAGYSSVFVDYSVNLPFTVLGVCLLLFKEFRDEFFPDKCLLMNNQHRPIRWATYIMILTAILSAGVFGTDQFIYANF